MMILLLQNIEFMHALATCDATSYPILESCLHVVKWTEPLDPTLIRTVAQATELKLQTNNKFNFVCAVVSFVSG